MNLSLVYRTVRLPVGRTGAVRKHSRSNVHRLQFLEEQLRGVGNVDLGDLGLILAGSAFERLL